MKSSTTGTLTALSFAAGMFAAHAFGQANTAEVHLAAARAAAGQDHPYFLVENSPRIPAAVKPKRDMIVTDGQKLTLGDTTLTFYITPGHTLGTISTLIPVKDNGRPHLVAEWGGTGFNFEQSRERFEAYIASAERFGGIVANSGADVLIGNHTNQDGSKIKLPLLAKRKPGDPHPYVIGNDSVRRYIKVAESCARAYATRYQ